MAAYDVFLSHNSKDKPEVEELARKLVKAGIRPWLDKWNLVPGEPWQEELEEALDDCQTVAVFLGRDGVGPWENEEMRSAIAERVRDKSRRVIPVLLPGANQPSSSDLPPFLRRLTWVKFEQRLDDEQAFHLLRSGIQGVAPGPGPEPEPLPPPPPPQPPGPFVGPIPFGIDDASIFYGREKCLERLVDKLSNQVSPLLVVHGLSGVGKSSLLQAGLVPRLKTEGYPVAYTSILDTPVRDVIQGIQKAFSARDDPSDTDILATINRLVQPRNRTFYLIVDQLERCFTLAPDDDERLAFWSAMGHLVRRQAICETKLVLAVRADWFYAFHQVSPIPLEVDPFHYQFPVERLSQEEAREALSKPLDQFKVSYDPELVQIIVDDLSSDDGTVNPPQLQIVGEALYTYVRESGRGALRLEVQDYRSLDGARAIVRNHLSSTVNYLGPSAQIGWQILMKLVGSGGRRISKPAEELKVNLSDRDFRDVTDHLVQARLLVRQLSSTDNTPVYTLTHDYLIEEINKHFEVNPDLQAWQTAERFLDIGLDDWRESKKTGGDGGLLLEEGRYEHICSQREKLGAQTKEANQFLMHSGLSLGKPSFSYWLARLSEDGCEDALAIVEDYALDARESVRQATHTAVSGAVREGSLCQEHQRGLKDLLIERFSAPTTGQADARRTEPLSPEIKESAAMLLWTLRGVASLRETLRFAPTVARVWGRYRRSQIAWSVGGALIALALMAGFLFIQSAQHGRWESIDTLYAGPVKAAAVDPGRSDTVYVVTEGGPVPGDGAALLRWQGDGEWQMLSRGLINAELLSFLVVRKEDGPRIYVSAYAAGILRSDDQGASWELVNKGLGSYVIGSLAVHPRNPNVILAGTNDRKGAFESQDGGDSWWDISGDELYASSVPSMVYTPFRGGTLFAGTEDGRIVVLQDTEPRWRLVAAFAGTGAINCLAAEQREGKSVYAGTSRGYVLASSDGGENWILRNRLPDVLDVLSMVVVPGEPDTVYADAFGIGGSILWRSVDGGQSWHPLSSGQFTRENAGWLLIHPQAPERLYAASSAGFFETVDGGSSWRFHDVGSPIVPVHGLALSPLENGPIYVASRGAVFTTLRPEERAWRRGEGLLAHAVREVIPDPLDASVAYAGVYLPNKWSVYVTEDGGANWRQTTPPTSIPTEYLNDTMALDVAAMDGQTILYAGTNGCGVLHSTDRGASWQTGGRQDCSLSDATPRNVRSMAIDPYSVDTLYVAADSNKVFVTTDRGQTWHTGEIALTARIRTIEVDPAIAGRVYLVAGAGGFWRSDDGARTWRRYSAGLEDKPLSDLAVIPDRSETVFVGSSHGEVWKTTDGGQHWRPVREDLSVADITVMDAKSWEHGIWLGSGSEGGGGIYRYRPGSLESVFGGK